MKRLVCLISGLLFSGMVMAATPAETCAAQAAEKKLAGAAKNSFTKKCEKDTAAAVTQRCEGAAKDKKLAGAAKTSFVNKCVKDGGPAQ
ncbi:hypothetical protein INR99_08015 [Chitinilyticum litopenaei]|uniref:PsiF repeat-containing protein n=2 Tax=Chitinilyticum piscinae TaxID=2866724 RepID=A0A8J7K1Y7_9NEIS|nr:hypothetical protein [Chitinilyticum piscinae]